MLKRWRVWLGLAISLFFLALALRGQDLERVRQALARFDFRVLPGALLLYFTGVWIRALRWRHLLAPIERFTAGQLFPVVVIGYMANNVLPFRLGEVVRAYVLRERAGVSTSASLATIAVERICDGLTMLGFLLVASQIIALNAQLRQLALVTTVIFGVLLALLWTAVVSGTVRATVLAALRVALPGALEARIIPVVEGFIDGLRVLRSGRDLAAVAIFSVLAWLFEAAMYLAIAAGFRLPAFGPAGALLTTASANLATLIPSSPGYVGTFEAGVQLVLNGLLRIPREQALSYAVVVHAALYFPITLWGLYYWSRASLSWRVVRQLEAKS